jgi:hypothetical protein
MVVQLGYFKDNSKGERKMEITKQAVQNTVEAMANGGTAIAVALGMGFGGSNSQVTRFLRELQEAGELARTITYTDTVYHAVGTKIKL